VAEYVKFRLTAAKIGVSMALGALIAGIAEMARSGPALHHAAKSALFLKLEGISGETKAAFLKLEDKWIKLNSLLVKIDHKLTSNYYDKRGVDANFLKITNANTQFLKIGDANASFLKITDANAEYLKIDGTASNSLKLGGLTSDAFLQGKGDVISGAVSVGPGQSQQVLQMPGGAISILIGLNQPGGPSGPSVTIQNNTSALLPAVQMGDGGTQSLDLPAHGSKQAVLNLQQTAHEVQVQIFPNAGGGFNDAVSILIALEPDPNNQGQYAGVAQMLIGLL
jgi:hypothetical protein